MPHQKPKVRLWAAAQTQDRAAVLAALRAGAPVNALNDQGWSALMWACQAYGALASPLVAALLAAGADPNLPGHACPPLSLATRQAVPVGPVVDALLAAGANPNARDERDERALVALLQRHVETSSPTAWTRSTLDAGIATVRRLLTAGAVLVDLNAAGDDIMTLAIRHRYADRAWLATWLVAREQAVLRSTLTTRDRAGDDENPRGRVRL